MRCIFQCSRSVTFSCGAGSADPYDGLTDPDPALFVSELQDAKIIFFLKFFCLLLFEGKFFFIILQS